ncbi:MAG: hypothetical protein P8X63_02810 [Desulfuromonadaceae bacterium]
MKKSIITLILAILLLIVGELLLQVRAQIRFGHSIFKVAQGKSTYWFNPDLGIKLLCPNVTIESEKSNLKTNSLGLRCHEISDTKADNEIRIAVVGASTIMGAYTKDNEQLLSSRLENSLQKSFPDFKITVINAGIAGYCLQDEWLIIEKLLIPLGVDYLVVYTGFNDIGKYCRSAVEAEGNIPKPLMQVSAPKWLLTVELITKNTVFLRDSNTRGVDMKDPGKLDTGDYSNSLRTLLKGIVDNKIPALIITNARSFRREMPLSLQLELSETARYYLECFDINGLHDVFDSHNQIIADMATEYGFNVIPLMDYLPGGSEYFADATHFSVKGTETVSMLIDKKITPEIKEIILSRTNN